MAPAMQPFRLLDLPPELRVHIYEYIVVRDTIELTFINDKSSSGLEYMIGSISNLGGWPDDKPMLNVFRLSKQILSEVRPLFYGNTLFYMDVTDHTPEKNSIKLAKLFLEDRPQALPFIHRIGFSIEEELNASGQSSIPSIPPDLFQSFVGLLAFHCKLTFLRVSVWTWIEGPVHVVDYRGAMTYMSTPKSAYGAPDWVIQLAAVNDLQGIDVYFESNSVALCRRNIAVLKYMRSMMARGGQRMRALDGIKVRLPHEIASDGYEVVSRRVNKRVRDRYLLCSMDIEQGSSYMSKERRVKVMPHRWCMDCGTFLRRKGCDCCPDAGDDRCYYGDMDQIQHIVRTGPGEQNLRCTRQAWMEGPFVTQAKEELDKLYGYGVWDSRRWAGGPITKYLPKDVTFEDFQHAKSLAEADVAILTTDYSAKGDYTQSDFGDTDSLCSIALVDEDAQT